MTMTKGNRTKFKQGIKNNRKKNNGNDKDEEDFSKREIILKSTRK